MRSLFKVKTKHTYLRPFS
jgi:hypothetical protein